MATLLLSDLHLPSGPSPLRDGFLAFLRGPARGAQRIYILGDLFEYWIGDDVGLEEHRSECQALRKVADAGTAVYVMHGNRDFLLGEDFARATGAQLLEDPTVVELAGVKTLLSHGDLWCLSDRTYQRFRAVVHNPLVRGAFARLPATLRRAVARRLRRVSHQRNGGLMQPIADVDDAAVRQAFDRHRVARIIHGHTHRPAEHREPGGRQRVVLADWRPGRHEYLRVDADGLHRDEVPED